VGFDVLSPLLVLLVKLHTPGPVFFRRARVGRHGRPFRIFKFRHERGAAAWRCADHGGWLRLLPMVCISFVPIVAQSKVLSRPAPPAYAIGFVDALLQAPDCDLLTLGAEWPAFAQLCSARGLGGNAVQDAWNRDGRPPPHCPPGEPHGLRTCAGADHRQRCGDPPRHRGRG